MRLQLTVFSLMVLAYLLLWQCSKLLPRAPARGYGAARAGGGGLGEKLEAMAKDSLRTYLPFAAVALLMFSSGKPELLPQWAGWAVVMLQFLRSLALAGSLPRVKAGLGLLALLCLIYLWVLQLPFFDPFPA